jgi:hypothetical protein
VVVLTDLTVLGVSWPPLKAAAKLKQQDLLTNTYLEVLRKLSPDTGGYINEVRSSLHMSFALGANISLVRS